MICRSPCSRSYSALCRRVRSDASDPALSRGDVRVVAATNRDLEEQAKVGNFREDLYWRLNVIHLHIPALRERPFDIPLLVEHFINKATEVPGRPQLDVLPETLAILTAYSWPGNVRELETPLNVR